jgi:chorismate dehydratase
MQNDKIRISAVSYLNTLPFLYGIKYSNLLSNFEFELDYPAICAQKLIENNVDIALIPVAAIPLVQNARFISDFCIGAHNEVKSVLLLSDVPLAQIKSILLDYQSKTSVNLVKVLANKLWKISPEWIAGEKGFENKIVGNTAGVVIGDRTFLLYNKYQYVYDLSSEWYKLTGLPFVFASWVCNKNIDQSFENQFNEALRFGINHIREVVIEYNELNPDSGIDLYEYLTKYISFEFNTQKKESLKQFYNFLFDLQLTTKNAIDLLV